MGEIKELSGATVAANTRITLADPALTLMYQNMGAAVEGVPRVMIGDAEVKQFVYEQDSIRASQLDRSPGDGYEQFKSRGRYRTISTKFKGLQVRSTDYDREVAARAGIGDPFAVDRIAARQKILQDLETTFISLVTTTGNYNSGCVVAAGTPWTNASGDPTANVQALKNAVTDRVGAVAGGEWRMYLGKGGWSDLFTNADIVNKWASAGYGAKQAGMSPTKMGVAEMLDLASIWVSEMIAGPATKTTTGPLMASNTRLWTDTNDKAVLAYVVPGGAFGVTQGVSQTGLAVVTRYGPGQLVGDLGAEYRDGSGGVQFSNEWDDYAPVGLMVDASDLLVGAAVLTDIHA